MPTRWMLEQRSDGGLAVKTSGEKVGAKFFDGRSARPRTASVSVAARDGAKALLIEPDGMNAIYWRTDNLRELRDQARDEGIVLQHVDDDLARLIVPHGHAEEVIREIAGNLAKRSVPKGMYKKLLFWAGGAVASVVLIMFVILPAMSDQLARMIPPEREAALGRTALSQIERYLLGSKKSLACTNSDGLKALEKMTARLTAQADIPYDLNVQVFDHDMINAFAVPGGNVVLFKGLLQAADTPEEVAGVLAHELGHVVNRDPTRLTLRSAGSVGILGMVFGDFAGGFFALVLAEQLISASYAQDAEAGADSFAHIALAQAGLPSEPLAGFFLKLKDKFGESDGLISHLASHPDLSGRAAAAEAANTVGSGTFEPILTEKEWRDLRAVCSLGSDSRNRFE